MLSPLIVVALIASVMNIVLALLTKNYNAFGGWLVASLCFLDSIITSLHM